MTNNELKIIIDRVQNDIENTIMDNEQYAIKLNQINQQLLEIKDLIALEIEQEMADRLSKYCNIVA